MCTISAFQPAMSKNHAKAIRWCESSITKCMVVVMEDAERDGDDIYRALYRTAEQLRQDVFNTMYCMWCVYHLPDSLEFIPKTVTYSGLTACFSKVFNTPAARVFGFEVGGSSTPNPVVLNELARWVNFIKDMHELCVANVNLAGRFRKQLAARREAARRAAAHELHAVLPCGDVVEYITHLAFGTAVAA